MGIIKGMLSLPFLIVKGVGSLAISVVKSPYKIYKNTQRRGFAKDFYNLQEIGVDVSDLDLYENEVNDKTNEAVKINNKINDYNKEKEKTEEKLLKVEESIQKMKQKKNRIFLMFSKEYRTQKKLLKIYKAQIEQYPEMISKEVVKFKSNRKDLENAKKDLKDFKKSIRREAKKYEDVINIMSYFNKHKNAIRKRFSSAEFNQIQTEMQQIKINQGMWAYNNISPKEYLEYLKGKITFGNNNQQQQGQAQQSQQQQNQQQQGQTQQSQQQQNQSQQAQPQEEQQQEQTTNYDVDLGHEEIGFLDRINKWMDRVSNSKPLSRAKRVIFGNRDNEEVTTAEDIYTYNKAGSDDTRSMGKKFREKYHVNIRRPRNKNNSGENDLNRTSDEQTRQADDDGLEP